MPTTIDQNAPEVSLAAPALVHERAWLERAAAALWRVRSSSGRVLGHLRLQEHELGTRYRAERLHLATGAFLCLGEFWSADEAVACLRYA